MVARSFPLMDLDPLEKTLAASHVNFMRSDQNACKLRQGSHARDSSSAKARSALSRLRAAKDLSADGDRPFALLRVTREYCSNCQVQFV